MRFVFVDDTKQKGRRNGMGTLMALGGVSFPEETLEEFARDFHTLYEEHNAPASEELKWSTPKSSWFRTEDGRKALTPMRESCLRLAKKHEASAVVVVFDLARTSLQGTEAEQQILKYLYERISMMLGREEASRAVVVCDKPGGGHQEEDAWIAATLELTRYGTNYVNPGGIVLPILTAPSHHHPHLQLADLVTGALVAALAGTDHGIALVDLIKPLLHKNYRGLIGGTGLKLFPDSIINLHHWVLGETAFSRGNSGVGLPWDGYGWSYTSSNGLAATAPGQACS